MVCEIYKVREVVRLSRDGDSIELPSTSGDFFLPMFKPQQGYHVMQSPVANLEVKVACNLT